MNLSFLPDVIASALGNVNMNYLSEIRLRAGQPVIIEYRGEYCYLCCSGAAGTARGALICDEVSKILYRAMGGCVYSHAEELKEGFITVNGGIRIGVAGEYVTENGRIKTIARPTSLNIRIPHNAFGCSKYVFDSLLKESLHSVLLFSRPGYGKTTMLRDLVINISARHRANVLVLDVRNEISGAGDGPCNLGETVDVVRCGEKLSSLQSAVRAMKPDLIITDELYGQDDMSAVSFARDCGIHVIASSHICDCDKLRRMPFEYYVRLNGIDTRPDLYDKDFNSVCNNSVYDVCGSAAVGGEEEKGGGLFGALRIQRASASEHEVRQGGHEGTCQRL